MSQPAVVDDADWPICSCVGVTEDEIVAAIALGAATVAAVEADCGAGSGCGGCRQDIVDLLKQHSANR